MKWASGLRVVTGFHDQGLSEQTQTAGGAWIQMFEVMRPASPQFSHKAIIPLDLLDRCPPFDFHHNGN